MTNKIFNKTIECYFDKDIEMFLQNNIDFDSVNSKLMAQSFEVIEQLDKSTTLPSKIPLNSHQVWLTSTISPQAMDAVSLKLTIATLLELNRVSDEWTHYVWTNNSDMIQDEIKAIKNVKVVLIDEFSDGLLWGELQNIIRLAEKSKSLFAQASDIARYMALYKIGGIYRDLDNLIFENRAEDLLKLMGMANLFAGKESEDTFAYIANGFIGASPAHPIINNVINSVKKNLDKHEHPDEVAEYIKFPCIKTHEIVYETGPAAFTMAIFQSANQDGNIDLIMPLSVFFNTQYIRHITTDSRCYAPDKPANITVDFKGIEIKSIAADMLCGDWYFHNNAYKQIIDYGPNVISLLYRESQLIPAAENGNLEEIEYYTSNGENVNSNKKYGFTPLYMAAAKNQVEAAKLLLKKGANPNLVNKNNVTPLHLAVSNGNNEMVLTLLKHGANPNIKYSNGATPLVIAVIKGYKDIVKMLLDAGADQTVTIENKPLSVIAQSLNFLEIAKLLQLKSKLALYQAAFTGDRNLVGKLLDAGEDINSVYTDRRITPLFVSIINNHTKTSEFIIEKGADVNLSNPLFISARYGHSNVTKLLLEAGADVNALYGNETPLYTAVYYGNLKDAEYLLQYNSTIQSDVLQTPLFISAFFKDRSPEVYQLMMNNYWQWLENERKNIVSASDGDEFKVVIVRFEEDLHWVDKEFGSDTQVVIYNKGPDNLDYLGSNCKIVKTPNVGWFGGTVLLYIAENYDKLSNKTLFIQGHPYDQGVYLPMLRYAGDIDSVCTNIVAKCEPTTLIEQSNKLQYYTPGQWAASKYHKFKPLNYTMVDFFHKYIDPKFPLAKTFMMDIGSQFAINIDKIKSRPREFYTSLLPLFNETYATADFCFEKGIDPLFGADVFNYDLKHIKKLDVTKASLDKLLFENVVLNKIDAVKNLIDAGVNINGLHTNNNITVLSIATENNFTSMVDLIIQGGADVNLKDPLSLSVRLGHSEITRLLLEAGANTEATVQGKTPLYVAAYLGHAKDAEYLLKHNATYQSDERYTPLYIANYFRDKSAQHNALNNLLMNYYWENINKDIFAIQPNDKTFEVVIVRFNEDLDWVYKEFGNNTNVTIYNKGEDDLDYLSPNYKIVKTPNIGWFGGTILLHIANNYNQITDRTLFIQACPYDAPIFLPLLRYKNNLNSNCNNIIAKCLPTNLIVESEVISTLHEHMNGKYEKFAYLNYTITDFFHKFIDEKFDVDKKFMVNLGTQFAIDLTKIKNHPQEYYASLLSLFNETYATADFYFERSLDPLFGANLQKPAIINKSIQASNNYDIAYVINLDRAKDRWNKLAPQLSRANIKYKRFKAIEGKDLLFKNALTNEIFNGNDLQNRSVSTAPNNVHQVICNPNENNPITFNYSGQLLKKPGEFGLWCSNKMIWLDALKNNYNNIIIFEDDIKIKVNNINQEIDGFIAHLPTNYDLGYLDFKPRNGTQYSLPGNKYVNVFDENFFSWGTHAIVFSKKAIKKLLSFSSYAGAIDIFYWLYSKSRNLNNINKPLLLETYSSSNLNLIEAETGYSFIDEREINIDFKSQYYDSVNEELIKAIVNKELNKIKALLEKGANPNHIAKDGNSMLQLAAILGYTDVADILLREAVDPDLKHKKGANALAMAVINGHKGVVKLLLDARADREITLQNSSLEQMAIKQNHTEVAEIIREHNAEDKSYINSLFMHAALKNNIAMVNRYLEAGANIDHVFQGNITSLLIAVSKGNLELVENLVGRGANVNISSPLFTSARNGHSETTKFLIDSGANIEALSNNNDNPIFAAVHNGHYQDVKHLLDAGSSIQSDRLHTPLFEAAYYNGRSPERSAIYNLLINHYWKWLEQELEAMPEIESKESFEAVLVRYKEDLHWAIKEYGFDTNVTIYNKGPNDIDYLPSNYKIVNIPNVGWFGGTILYHIVTNYDQLADITFFGQGLIYDQELYLPAIRYKGYINSTCKNIVAKCENTTLLEQSNKLANYTKEQWTASKYNKFIPLNYTMIDYFNKNVCPDFPLDKPFKLDLGAQFAVKSSQIRLNSKEYYASKLEDFNDTYSYADFCLEKAWDVMFDPEYAECYKNHLELSGDMSII